MSIRINSKKVHTFVLSLTRAERGYMVSCLAISDSILSLINDFGLTKQQVCEKFQITPRQYKAFVNGAFNYDMNHMANLNDWYVELKASRLEKEAPVQFPDYKYSKKPDQKPE